MKRLALLAAVVAMMVVGASATVASAGNDTPGCQSATWSFSLTYPVFGTFPGTVSLERCVPKGAHNDEFTLTGSGTAGGCSVTVSGTIKANDINMVWTPVGSCTTASLTFTGTLNWSVGTGSGSGDFVDNPFGPGTWTATRTS
jgi:hypothetical protein